MKKYLFLSIGGLALLSLSFLAFKPTTKMDAHPDKINWISIEEAISLSDNSDKGFVIDVYTDWCKWCKVMDKETFQNPKVVDYINANYHAVKFDAEQQTAINFEGKEYGYVQVGNKGLNKFVYELLDNRTAYPSLVIFDKKMKNKTVLKGFQKVDPLLEQLSKLNMSNSLTGKTK